MARLQLSSRDQPFNRELMGDYETDSCFREAFLWKGTSFRSLAKDKIGPREACFNEITAE